MRFLSLLLCFLYLSSELFVPIESFQNVSGLRRTFVYRKRLQPIFAAPSPPSFQASTLLEDNSESEENLVIANQPLKPQSTRADGPKYGYQKEYQILLFLLLLFSYNQFCRQLIYYFSDFISITDTETTNSFQFMNQDLNFSKDQYATLASFGFTTSFVLAYFVATLVADRFSRTNVIAISCFVWSVITCLQGKVDSFSQLLLLRRALGVSQAFLNPAVYSFIAEIFPKNLIATTTGIYNGGIYMGGGLASLSILLGKSIGWRDSFLVIGFLGILLSVLAKIFVSEPRKDIIPSSKQLDEVWTFTGSLLNYFNDVTEILSIEQVKTLLIASIFRFVAGFTITAWKTPFTFQQFPNLKDYFAGSNAAIITFGGLLSTFLGGWLSDYIIKGDENVSTLKKHDSKGQEIKRFPTKKRKYSRSWIPAIGSLLAIPTWFGFMTITEPSLAFTCLFFEYIVAECWFGPTLASIFQVIPEKKKRTIPSLFVILAAFGNIGPKIVTFLMKLHFSLPAYTSLQSSLIVVVGFAYFISAGFFLKAAIHDQKRLGFTH